jgi:predicted lipid-binding transport protein (Tim44 family)
VRPPSVIGTRPQCGQVSVSVVVLVQTSTRPACQGQGTGTGAVHRRDTASPPGMSRLAARLVVVTSRRQPPKRPALWLGGFIASGLFGKLMDDLSWKVILWVIGIGLAFGLLLLALYDVLVWVDRRFFAPRRKERARQAIRRQLGPTPHSRRLVAAEHGNSRGRNRTSRVIASRSGGRAGASDGYAEAS